MSLGSSGSLLSVAGVGDRNATKHTKVHAQQPAFIECSFPYIDLRVHRVLTQICLCPQQARPALQ